MNQQFCEANKKNLIY